MRDQNQLHAAVVELITLDDAEIKYSTIQNWYPGDEKGVGGIYNFVTKRGKCLGKNSKISLDPSGDRLCNHLEVSGACFCRAITPSASSTRWRWRRVASRPTRARR